MKKTPSSLDYESLLHELSLRNWRRAIHAGDLARALANAETLTRSRERFWRWQGLLGLAGTHLCEGSSKKALAALAAASRVYSDVPSFAIPACEIEAHVWLDARGSAETTVAARATGRETELLLSHRGRALARLGRTKDALELAAEISRRKGNWSTLLSHHVRAEVALAAERKSDALAELHAGLEVLSASERKLGATPAPLVLYALAVELVEADRERALAVFDEVASASDVLFFWPVPCIRSWYWRGALLRSLGDPASARAAFERFLRFWGRGDLDRDRVEDALQFVKA